MKILAVLNTITNSFVLAEAPEGVTLKSRCENSMSPNKILITVPDEIVTLRDSAPAELEELAATLSTKEQLIEEMNAINADLNMKLNEAGALIDGLKEELQKRDTAATQEDGPNTVTSEIVDESKLPPELQVAAEDQGNG